jgi:hypothetical protein
VGEVVKPRPFLAGLGVAYLALFTLDGTLSVAHAALQLLAGSVALGGAQAVAAYIAIGAAPCALLCCAISPRWPAYVYLPPVAVTMWFALGGEPISSAVGRERAFAVLSAVQVAFAALAWMLLWIALRRHGGLRGFSAERRALSGARLAVFAVGSLVAGPFLVAGYVVLATVSWLEAATDGFLDVGSEGVAIAERRYRRGEQEVRLVGMMHIGQPESYEVLFDSFRGGSTLVLEEGVSDRDRRLAKGLSYGKAARALGLDAQGSISTYFHEARDAALDEDAGDPPWPDVTNADVDVAEFSPSTIAFIDRAGTVWASDQPLGALLEIMRHPPPAADMDRLFAEIVDMRNQRVIEALEHGLRTYRRVIVPWGALHLPGIARAIEQDGFVREAETKRLLVSWSTVLAALRR